MKKPFYLLIAALAVAGAVTLLPSSRRGATGAPVARAANERTPAGAGRLTEPPPRPEPTVDPARLTALERQVAALAASREPRADAPAEARADRSPEAAAELRQRALAEQHDRLARHEREPIDRAWAEQTAASLEANLKSLLDSGDHSEKLADVSCRSSGCVATLRFPSYGDARDGFFHYATSFYDVACARSVALDDPEDATTPYDVKILFTSCQRP